MEISSDEINWKRRAKVFSPEAPFPNLINIYIVNPSTARKRMKGYFISILEKSTFIRRARFLSDIFAAG